MFGKLFRSSQSAESSAEPSSSSAPSPPSTSSSEASDAAATTCSAASAAETAAARQYELDRPRRTLAEELALQNALYPEVTDVPTCMQLLCVCLSSDEEGRLAGELELGGAPRPACSELTPFLTPTLLFDRDLQRCQDAVPYECVSSADLLLVSLS